MKKVKKEKIFSISFWLILSVLIILQILPSLEPSLEIKNPETIRGCLMFSAFAALVIITLRSRVYLKFSVSMFSITSVLILHWGDIIYINFLWLWTIVWIISLFSIAGMVIHRIRNNKEWSSIKFYTYSTIILLFIIGHIILPLVFAGEIYIPFLFN